mmetsp:Transcript_107299/g.256184  ORF Transcript_107299/g.256184 Transcript_107299/m.256184 type:complete len:216 (+) Transcript_107299:1604-2251(+)
MENHRLPLCDEVEVTREGVCEAPERMSGAGDSHILQPCIGHHLLPCLHAHLHAGHQGLVCCHVDFSFLDHEPLSAGPGLILHPHGLGPIENAQHADDWHRVLSQSQLFKEVVGLEHHVPDAGSRQPLWLETLLLRCGLNILRINRIQGEEGLASRLPADLQGKGQVLQIHGSCRLCCGCHTHGARGLVPNEAGKAPQLAKAQLPRQRGTGGHQRR